MFSGLKVGSKGLFSILDSGTVKFQALFKLFDCVLLTLCVQCTVHTVTFNCVLQLLNSLVH